MKLDDALLWLNDRLGKNVAVWVAVRRGDLEPAVFEAEGELRHWSEGSVATRAASRDDIAGYYHVGGASLDLSNVHALEVMIWPDDHSHLTVRIDEKTTLEVVEQDEEQP